MSLYIPKMSDTPAITIAGLASNFNELADNLNELEDNFNELASNFQAFDGSQIVEQGSNENGEYIRWENGLQICDGSYKFLNVSSTNVPNISGLYYVSTELLFPASFAGRDVNVITGGGRPNVNAFVIGSMYTQVSATGFTAIGYKNQEHPTWEVWIDYIAIGRWK